MSTLRVSVIVCSIDASKFARVSECYRRLLAPVAHEIIGIHDAKSLAEGYNRGLSQTTGDIVIFSHDDILIIEPDFAAKLERDLANFDVLGFAGASRVTEGFWCAAGFPHLHGVVAHALPKRRSLTMNIFGVPDWPVVPGIKLLDGLCIIATRKAADDIQFDAETFNGFHLYDLDFSFRAYLAGYRIGVICDIPIIHESAGQFDATYMHYAAHFSLKYERWFAPKELSADAQASAIRNPPSKGLTLPDHHALLTVWQRGILERATVSLGRYNEFN